MPIALSIKAFFTPKAGNSALDYEDAFGWANSRNGVHPPLNLFERFRSDDLPLRVAVADGATETSFSAVWAQILTRAFCDERITLGGCSEPLQKCRRLWKRVVGAQPLPWYAEQKMAMGAYAAIVGLTISESRTENRREWSAIAVGDSCCFHFRENELSTSFPMTHWEEFSSRPVLISSIFQDAEIAFSSVSGTWRPGDEFILASDAVACWLLRAWSLRSDPLEYLRSINTNDDFLGFIEQQRIDILEDGTRMMRNDDCTLVRITISGD